MGVNKGLPKKSLSSVTLLVPCLIDSVPDFGNLSCHQITGTTLKNTNIKMRNTKQYRNANFQNSKQKHYDTTIFRMFSISPG